MLVENWMATNVIAVKPDTSLLKCRNLLKEHQIRRLPVVDDQNRVVGIISDRDVKGASPSKATALEVHEMQYLLAELKAKDIMTAKPVTIKPWDSVEQAAIIMMDKKFGGLPVVSEDNKLVGIITDQDIFKLLINITGARVEGMQFAFELPDTPGSMRVIFDTMRKHNARIIRCCPLIWKTTSARSTSVSAAWKNRLSKPSSRIWKRPARCCWLLPMTCS